MNGGCIGCRRFCCEENPVAGGLESAYSAVPQYRGRSGAKSPGQDRGW